MTETPGVLADAQTEPVFEDYFGFDEIKQWFFPDGKQFVQFQVMNEGQKSRFQKLTNRDITLSRTSGDAKIKADPAEERHALLTSSVVGWSLYRNGQPVPFSIGSNGAAFEQWLNAANPKLVEDLEFEIRKSNPWLQAEMTVEEIDKEMDRLRELRDEIVKRDAAKASSSVR
jgi:hypothetical protein